MSDANAVSGVSRHWRPLWAVGWIGLIACVLIRPALQNGYPINFPDTAGYVKAAFTLIPELRAFGYSLFLRGSGIGISLWLGVIAQALITAFLIVRVADVFLCEHRWQVWGVPLVCAASLLGGGVALHASRLLADITTPWLFLSATLWLISRRAVDRWTAACTLQISLPSHAANLPILLGTLVVFGSISFIWRNPAAQQLRRALAVLGLVTFAVLGVAQATYAFVSAGRTPFVLPGGTAFMAGRLANTGILAKTLDIECPRRQWRYCDHRDSVAEYGGKLDNWFLWNESSPFKELGGFQDDTEHREVVAAAMRCCWSDIAATTVINAWHQFWMVSNRLGKDESYGHWLGELLEAHVPNDVDAYRGRKQRAAGRHKITFLQFDETLVFGSFVLIAVGVAMIAVERRRWKTVGLLAGVFLFLAANAAVIALASSPDPRYQARIAWLLPYCVGLGLFDLIPASERRSSEMLPVE